MRGGGNRLITSPVRGGHWDQTATALALNLLPFLVIARGHPIYQQVRYKR